MKTIAQIKTIAQVKIPYLNLSEAFVYEQITRMRRYRSIVLTDKPMANLDLFPLKEIFHLTEVADLERLLVTQGVSLIHAHSVPAALAMLEVKARLNLPLLVSLYETELNLLSRKNRPHVQQLQNIFRQGEHLFVVSHHMRERLAELGCQRQKVTILRPGIDMERFPFRPRAPGGSDKTICIASMVKFKDRGGLPMLIRAFAKVHDAFPNTGLEIYGNGERFQARLQELAASLNLARHVRLRGIPTGAKLADALTKAHLFCLPASSWGKSGISVPILLAEAMATGLPVVSTTYPGIEELITNGVNGLLVPPGDLDGLVTRLAYLLGHREEWASMGRAAHDRVKTSYNLARQVEKLERLYDQFT
ncbi:MAG: glycosyltransferase family 4 protein [Syntrophothermus sp.]